MRFVWSGVARDAYARGRNLPVQQSTKVDLIINLKTAKVLGIIVPPSLLA
jgi:putative ABC transport system substrate-binding protein